MNALARWMMVPTVAAIVLSATGAALSGTVQVSLNSRPDPQVLQGKSGGSKSSDCGFISATPNETVKVTEAIPYIKFSVQSAGDPTLLIDGPSGRFCVLSEGDGRGPQMSGYLAPGTYSIFVGDRTQGQHPYTLSITQNR